MKNRLQHFSITVSKWGSSTAAFILAIAGVLAWLLLGPVFHYSNTWLITITVITDVIIFIMVFSIQNTQFRDSKALQLKLNELIIANNKARDMFIGLEELTDSELSELDREFKALLSRSEATTAMHKLHQHIKHEQARRPSLYDQVGDFVDGLLKPLSGREDPK